MIIDRVGRKQLVYYGVSGMVVSLLLIGIIFLFGDSWGVSSLFLLGFFLFYVFCCAVSICAVVFVLLSEMYPTKVRGLAMSIAGFALWIGTYLIGQLTPWMLQNLTPAGTFFLFAVMCVPYMLIVWKLVPETTGKSLEEIERYWTRSEQKKKERALNNSKLTTTEKYREAAGGFLHGHSRNVSRLRCTLYLSIIKTILWILRN